MATFRFLKRIARTSDIAHSNPYVMFHHVKTPLALRRSFTTGDSVFQQGKRVWNSSTGWYALPLSIGVSLILVNYLFSRKEEESAGMHTRVEGPLHIRLYTSLPLRYLSQCWGYVNDLVVPVPLRAPLYHLYSFICGCNLDEMEETDLTKFENLGQFFYRTIKPGVRTIAPRKEAALVSPADGRVLHFGTVEHDEIEQVKGVTYSLNALLGPNPNSNADPMEGPTYTPRKGNKLFFTVIYLAPGDYHRFHSPTEWNIDLMRHFAGEMYSVSPAMVKKLRHLFSLNERVSLIGDWEYGLFSMVPVAATNVGKIILNFAPNLLTNVPHKELAQPLGTHIEEKVISDCGTKKLSYSRGNEMGGFKLGSTVVLVFEAPESFQFSVTEGQKIKLGTPIGK